MCGILGFATLGNLQETKESFSNALSLLAHRGPDFSSFVQDKNIFLGHTRLSIIDLDRRSHQPMHFQEKYTLIFNGEIYNYKEVRAELQTQGYHFKTHGDAEVLLCAYDFWGEKCVEHFNGMWAFAIYDKFKNILFCSRDRFGEKPFFYYKDEEKFIFASEIKAILPFLKTIKANVPAMIPFIVRGNIDCYKNETFFKDIYRLNPSQNMVVDLEILALCKSNYYAIKPQEVSLKNPALALRELLEDSIRLRLRSDVPIGSCLSGGLDSSCVNALIARLNPNKNNFVAIHAKSTLKENDESQYAKRVAESLGVELCIVEPSKQDYLDNLEAVMLAQDEPFGSTSLYMQYLVMQKARELGIKVMFDGQGADEIFLGYEHYFKYIYKELQEKGKDECFFQNLKKFRYSNEAILNGLDGVEDFEIAFSRILKGSNIKAKYLSKEDLCELFGYTDFPSFNRQVIMQMGLQSLLRFEDRDSMAFGVESRLPYLDSRIVDFVLNLSVEVKFQGGYLKYLLRKACEDLLPADIIWRYNKLGFESPQRYWFDDLREEMKEAINHSKIIQEIFIKPDIREDNFLWRLFNIAKWEKLYKVEL
ncbi:asparagine synthase (glutamine-hydrolyzing) [uncultured Helicobacter sp.]|uniref:asparagine synthase (glutamine-hydrolyzing) n=1 Tax=uncultured Helicobacter sp. TaxID=175537 RepID=UPI00260586D8|nr:asparagine synthase (glutamine-hydrolyzing) [uncultured Helicobacter sp.]